jgi:hypothetical protein
MARATKAAKRFTIVSAQAAYAAGFMTAAQQYKGILVNGARSFGEAIDQFNKIEDNVAQIAKKHVTEDLVKQGAKLDGFDFKLENTPKGLFVELVPVQLPPQVQAQLAEQEKQAAAANKAPAAKKAAPLAPAVQKRPGRPAKAALAAVK